MKPQLTTLHPSRASLLRSRRLLLPRRKKERHKDLRHLLIRSLMLRLLSHITKRLTTKAIRNISRPLTPIILPRLKSPSITIRVKRFRHHQAHQLRSSKKFHSICRCLFPCPSV